MKIVVICCFGKRPLLELVAPLLGRPNSGENELKLPKAQAKDTIETMVDGEIISYPATWDKK